MYNPADGLRGDSCGAEVLGGQAAADQGDGKQVVVDNSGRSLCMGRSECPDAQDEDGDAEGQQCDVADETQVTSDRGHWRPPAVDRETCGWTQPCRIPGTF